MTANLSFFWCLLANLLQTPLKKVGNSDILVYRDGSFGHHEGPGKCQR